jgi:hypothetical protein
MLQENVHDWDEDWVIGVTSAKFGSLPVQYKTLKAIVLI